MREAGTDLHFTPADGLRVVQFTTGNGLAFYGGKFTASLANFKMTRLQKNWRALQDGMFESAGVNFEKRNSLRPPLGFSS